jgi:hypothetical protein
MKIMTSSEIWSHRREIMILSENYFPLNAYIFQYPMIIWKEWLFFINHFEDFLYTMEILWKSSSTIFLPQGRGEIVDVLHGASDS